MAALPVNFDADLHELVSHDAKEKRRTSSGKASNMPVPGSALTGRWSVQQLVSSDR
jgi:hypothetical protein